MKLSRTVLRRLQLDARSTGDKVQVDLCERALKGDDDAMRLCVMVVEGRCAK